MSADPRIYRLVDTINQPTNQPVGAEGKEAIEGSGTVVILKWTLTENWIVLHSQIHIKTVRASPGRPPWKAGWAQGVDVSQRDGMFTCGFVRNVRGTSLYI